MKYDTDDSVKNPPLDDAAGNNLSTEEDCGGLLNAMREYADDHCEDEDMDTQYKMFWTQLRQDGNSYALLVADGNSAPVLLKYEKDETLSEHEDPPTLKRSRSEPIKDRIGTPESLRDLPTEERKELLVEKNRPLEHTEPASCRPNEGTSLKYYPKVDSEKSKCNPEKQSATGVEETFQVFLNCLRWVGDNMVIVDEDGNKVVYEEDYDAAASSTSAILGTESDPHCSAGKFTPFLEKRFDSAVDDDEGCCIRSHTTSVSSTFRENLMSVLRKPYDHREYEELWAEISLRRPLERHRDLRGRIIKYSVGLSKSYLDQYYGLAKKVDLFRHDHRKVLNILRGFFFWLKNLAHEGAFCPWLDKSCLAVTPLC